MAIGTWPRTYARVPDTGPVPPHVGPIVTVKTLLVASGLWVPICVPYVSAVTPLKFGAPEAPRRPPGGLFSLLQPILAPWSASCPSRWPLGGLNCALLWASWGLPGCLRGPKMIKTWCEMDIFTSLLQLGHDSHTWPQDGPTMAPRRPQDGPKTAPRGPCWPPGAHKRATKRHLEPSKWPA